MSKTKPLPSLSSVFGKKTSAVSKSWSDLWDEDIEEEEEAEKQIKARQAQNARTWSHESTREDDTIRQISPLESKSASFVNSLKMSPETGHAVVNDIDGDLVADGFFFHETPAKPVYQPSPRRYSPPSKRSTLDKWSALGERRRAYTGTSESESEKSPELWKGRRNMVGFGGGFTGFGALNWDNKANTAIKDKSKGCPWVRDRNRDETEHRGKSKPLIDHGDLEWVDRHSLGGFWNDFHL